MNFLPLVFRLWRTAHVKGASHFFASEKASPGHALSALISRGFLMTCRFDGHAPFFGSFPLLP